MKIPQVKVNGEWLSGEDIRLVDAPDVKVVKPDIVWWEYAYRHAIIGGRTGASFESLEKMRALIQHKTPIGVVKYTISGATGELSAEVIR